MNRVTLYGNVGKDPNVTNLESGKKVAKFSLATNKTYSNNSGEKITETQWHNIILWGKIAETAEKYIKKGSSIILEGEISYRSYDNKDNVTIHITEIIGHAFHFTGSKEAKEPKSESKAERAEDDPSYIPENINQPNDLPY